MSTSDQSQPPATEREKAIRCEEARTRERAPH